MNPAIATIVVAVVAVFGAVVGAVVSAWLNKDKDDATVADQVSKAWTPLVSELRTEVAETKRECVDCRKELGLVKKALRATVRALDSDDPEAIKTAIEAARELV